MSLAQVRAIRKTVMAKIGRLARNAVAAGLFALAASAAHAQSFPPKTIRFMSPGSPGTTADIIPRLLGEIMGKRMGTTFLVENRPGANGILSANVMLTAPADGGTLLLTTMGALSMNPHVLPSMPFDVKTDFTPLALAASMPMVLLVNPDRIPANSLKDFVAWGKAHPGFNFASAGDASTAAISMILLNKMAGLEGTHVKFRGYGPGIEGVMKGELDTIAPDIGSALARLSEGKLRALGVTTAARSTVLPDVPTFREQGYDMDVALWFGIFVRPGTPAAITDRLTGEIEYAMKQPETQQKFKALGLTPGDKFGKDFVKYYEDDLAKWATILPPLNIRVTD